MAGVELFSHPALHTRYRAGLCSAAALALLLITVLTYVPPLLVAYRSHGERPLDPARRGPARRSAVLRPRAVSARRFLAEAERVPGAAHCAVPVRGALRGHHRARPGQLLGVEHVPSVQQAPGGPAASPAPVGRPARGRPGSGGGKRGWGAGPGERQRAKGMSVGGACEQAAYHALLPSSSSSFMHNLVPHSKNRLGQVIFNQFYSLSVLQNHRISEVGKDP